MSGRRRSTRSTTARADPLPSTPEKDEEFLRQVRARAEEQRKRYAEEKKREQQEPELEDGPAE